MQAWHYWEKDESCWPYYYLINAFGHQANTHRSHPHQSNSIALFTPPFNVSTPFQGWKIPHTSELPRMLTRQHRSSVWDKEILISLVALSSPTFVPCPSHGERWLLWNLISVISSRCFFTPLLGFRVVLWKKHHRALGWQRMPPGSFGQIGAIKWCVIQD